MVSRGGASGLFILVYDPDKKNQAIRMVNNPDNYHPD
jgi:hypothetical protein